MKDPDKEVIYYCNQGDPYCIYPKCRCNTRPEQSTKDRILSETSEETKQKVRLHADSLVNKQERNIIDDWLEKNGNPEISKQVEQEAEELYLEEEALRFLPRSEVEHDADFIIGFGVGALWQAERMHSKQDVQNLIKIIEWYDEESDVRPNYDEKLGDLTMWEWFEQFKKNINEKY